MMLITCAIWEKFFIINKFPLIDMYPLLISDFLLYRLKFEEINGGKFKSKDINDWEFEFIPEEERTKFALIYIDINSGNY